MCCTLSNVKCITYFLKEFWLAIYQRKISVLMFWGILVRPPSSVFNSPPISVSLPLSTSYCSRVKRKCSRRSRRPCLTSTCSRSLISQSYQLRCLSAEKAFLKHWSTLRLHLQLVVIFVHLCYFHWHRHSANFLIIVTGTIYSVTIHTYVASGSCRSRLITLCTTLTWHQAPVGVDLELFATHLRGIRLL